MVISIILGGKLVRGRVCRGRVCRGGVGQGPSRLGVDFVRGRDVQLYMQILRASGKIGLANRATLVK